MDYLSTMKVMRLARDAKSTKGAERELLYALIMRSNPKKNYLCWPSYRLLAEDTQLNPKTLRIAAASLEKKGLISRSLRPHRSNCFFVNVGLLVKQALAAGKAKVDDNQPVSPFDPEVNHDEEAGDEA